MGRFVNKATGVVFSVSDDKDDRYAGAGYGSPDDAPDESKGYGQMKAADLKAEIERRNADREDDAKLSTAGNKAALVALLEADDASDEDSIDEEPEGSAVEGSEN